MHQLPVLLRTGLLEQILRLGERCIKALLAPLVDELLWDVVGPARDYSFVARGDFGADERCEGVGEGADCEEATRVGK